MVEDYLTPNHFLKDKEAMVLFLPTEATNPSHFAALLNLVLLE
jgi:hypothetical protein